MADAYIQFLIFVQIHAIRAQTLRLFKAESVRLHWLTVAVAGRRAAGCKL